jgi:hypothetical protein
MVNVNLGVGLGWPLTYINQSARDATPART